MTLPNLTPLTEKQSALVAENLHVAEMFTSIAHGKKQGMNRDDLFDAAVDGLISASRRYDPATGYTFATYAGHRVKGSIQDYIRDLLGFRLKTPRPKEVSVETLAESIDMENCESDELFADQTTVNPLDALGDDEGVKRIVQHLNPRYRALAVMYLHGLTLRECGAMLGLAESRISQITLMLQKSLRDNPPPGMEKIIERMRGARKENRGGAYQTRKEIDLEEFAERLGLSPPKETKLRPSTYQTLRAGTRARRMKFIDREVAVIKARRSRGDRCEDLAKEYGTTMHTIYGIWNGRTIAYRDIEPADLSQSVAS